MMTIKIILLIFLSLQITTESLKICFHENSASERGTAIAIFDYAHYAEKLLSHESHIIFPSRSNHTTALMKFKNRFNVTFYDGPTGGANLPIHAISQGCNMLYLIKSGNKSSTPAYPDAFSPELPTVVHAVFEWDPHGSAYAAISPTVHPNHDKSFVVPHVVTEPHLKVSNKFLRAKLQIPDSALIVCRHGGYDTFSLPMAQDAVKSLLQKYNGSKLQFIFLNTLYFGITSPQIHFLKRTADIMKKENFFSACDVMLHARKDGETFGLAVAEFSVRQKPVITADIKDVPAFHAEVLKDAAFYYQSEKDIINIISDFIQNGIPKKNYNAYQAFTPEKVMEKFRQLFIDPIFNKDALQRVTPPTKALKTKNFCILISSEKVSRYHHYIDS